MQTNYEPLQLMLRGNHLDTIAIRSAAIATGPWAARAKKIRAIAKKVLAAIREAFRPMADENWFDKP